MPILFGAPTFDDINSCHILALSHIYSPYYKPEIAKRHIPHLHIDLKLPNFHQLIVQNIFLDTTLG